MDVDKLDRKQLQKELTARKLRAIGTTEELKARLKKHLEKSRKDISSSEDDTEMGEDRKKEESDDDEHSMVAKEEKEENEGLRFIL